MSQITVISSAPKHSKKNIRAVIREKLSLSLADYRSLIGEKKFDSQIRKTARRLGENFVKAMPKKPKKQKNEQVEKTL